MSGAAPQPAAGEPCSLVVPARNAMRTLEACLTAAASLVRAGELAEILVVDDGSTDATDAVAARLGARCLRLGGAGPGAARNAGWRAAVSPLVWFLDADCVPEPDALRWLRAGLAPGVAGVGGSYGLAEAGSRLARLIHEEIRARHRAMGREVDFLGGFNVLYRRDALAAAGGFDEREFNGPGSPGAEDADLAFRLVAAGARLRFEPRSIARHHHPTRLGPYLRAQRVHGYWGARLYLRHRRRGLGHAYSGLADHLQPPLALLGAAALAATAAWPRAAAVAGGAAAAVLLLQVPMTLRLARNLPPATWLLYPALGLLRAAARGAGLAQGAASLLSTGRRPPPRR